MAVLYTEGVDTSTAKAMIAKVFARGVKATVDLQVLITALELLGYTVTQTTGWDVVDKRFEDGPLRRKKIPIIDYLNKLQVYHSYTGVITKRTHIDIYDGDEIDQFALDGIKKLVNDGHEQFKRTYTQVKKPSADDTPKLGDTGYGLAEVSISTEDKENSFIEFKFKGIVVASPAVIITTPDKVKKKIIFRAEEDVNALKSAPLWTFLYKNKLKENSIDFLGGADTAKEIISTLTAKARDLENTGTCQICDQNVKLKNNLIVHHGFTVPRWGSGRQGGCFGVDYQPYETGTDAIRNFLVFLDKRKKVLTKELKTWTKNPPESFTYTDWRKKTITVKKGDDSYAYEVRKQVQEIESALNYIARDEDTFNQKIKRWKPDVLPAEKDRLTRARLGLK